MTGYENEWVQLKPGQHSVRYSTLPAGNYKFEVKYMPSINSDKEQVISIDVTGDSLFLEELVVRYHYSNRYHRLGCSMLYIRRLG